MSDDWDAFALTFGVYGSVVILLLATVILFTMYLGRESMVVEEVVVHPVKSCRGLIVEIGEIDRLGLVGDRRYAVVYEKKKGEPRLLTGRENGKMVLLEAQLDRVRGRLASLDAPGMDTLHLANVVFPEQVTAGLFDSEFAVSVSNDAGVRAWLQEYLGHPADLATLTARHERSMGEMYDRFPRAKGVSPAMADGFPFLLCTTESLTELRRPCPEGKNLTMRHFRPNIVVSGAGVPWAEDTWKRIRIGRTEFYCVKSCTRCTFTTIDPRTGEKSTSLEPFKTLKRIRRAEHLTQAGRPEAEKSGSEAAVFFGMNLIQKTFPAVIRPGDTVEVLERWSSTS